MKKRDDLLDTCTVCGEQELQETLKQSICMKEYEKLTMQRLQKMGTATLKNSIAIVFLTCVTIVLAITILSDTKANGIESTSQSPIVAVILVLVLIAVFIVKRHRAIRRVDRDFNLEHPQYSRMFRTVHRLKH